MRQIMTIIILSPVMIITIIPSKPKPKKATQPTSLRTSGVEVFQNSFAVKN